MLKLLCVTAHPDDEAGAFGGTLLLYAEGGVQTHVICMTAGTAARNRGTARSDEELATLRRAEFAASCKLLRVFHSEVLHYVDSKLDRSDLHQAVGDVVLRMRQIRPQVVITFGPDGGLTGHADHAMAGVFATLAFEWAGRSDRYSGQLQGGLAPHLPQKLYHLASGYVLTDREPIAPPTITARIEVGAERFRIKQQAFQLHRTQAPLFERVAENIFSHDPVELYHLAATCEPQAVRLETDLFAGVTND